MFKPIQSGFWPCLLLCVPFVAHAFDTSPAEVELTPSATFAEFSGGATSAPNPVALCLTKTIDCDTLSLTVTLPEGFTALHPGTTVEISLDSGSDYDFVVREAESRARLFTTRASLLEERGDVRNAASAWAAISPPNSRPPAPKAAVLRKVSPSPSSRTRSAIQLCMVLHRCRAQLPHVNGSPWTPLTAGLGAIR